MADSKPVKQEDLEATSATKYVDQFPGVDVRTIPKLYVGERPLTLSRLHDDTCSLYRMFNSLNFRLADVSIPFSNAYYPLNLKNTF